ncbi:type II toxin-antitoxin system VapC family toxin [Dyadobacter sp. CY312]|uniref:type II toxin-antitoxin system VapC family toxin n=1 Tax=Dyadobacter sp. CY312 TaxID=2907303 RepID=UPI001F1F457D|nr:type II toxin-antitoxin system VapC family toxin [Dyadobacter sp. CY312]MCE7042914.1 type II toxin-antitoxin system VapC family toxin [Dyadobacter sp. CY312]
MIGEKILVDTNVFINLAEGKEGIELHLQGREIFVSVITEIELLGFYQISESEKQYFNFLLGDCSILGLTDVIKEQAIKLKQFHRIKLPDAIIAATAQFLKVELITFDKGFATIPNLDLILLEF